MQLRFLLPDAISGEGFLGQPKNYFNPDRNIRFRAVMQDGRHMAILAFSFKENDYIILARTDQDDVF